MANLRVLLASWDEGSLFFLGPHGHHVRSRWRDQVAKILPPGLQSMTLLREIFVPIVDAGHRPVGMVEDTRDNEPRDAVILITGIALEYRKKLLERPRLHA